MKKPPGKIIFRLKIVFLLVIFVVLSLFLRTTLQRRRANQGLITYRLRPMDLVISVREGGNLQALRSQKITNQVPGSRTILEVVEEGTQITEEDVKKGRVLVRLDSKDIEDRIQQMQITVENSEAAYTEAQENLLIQKKQNESDMKAAELKVRFARLDLEKYLGSTLTETFLQNPKISPEKLLASKSLGGEALKKKRQVETDIDLAKEEVARAQDRTNWSAQLAEKGYITKTELEADKLSLQEKQVSLEQANLSADLYFRYDFPKQVEQLYSDYLEAQAELERTRAKCQARLIQAEANVKSKRATHMFNLSNLHDLEKQLKDCTIVATQPGFVVYATSDRPWRTETPIQAGTTVRQNQDLLTLPDFSSMGVVVKIHESAIDRVRVGQKAQVRVDAFPDRLLTGEVKNIALMPDPTLKFMNPDLNVYLTQISLDHVYDFLKPGMTAQVEILVQELKNVLAVPILGISFRGEKAVCHVLERKGIVDRFVQLGESNEQYIEVKSGLKEGEVIVLSGSTSLPVSSREEKPGSKQPPPSGSEKKETGKDVGVKPPVPDEAQRGQTATGLPPEESKSAVSERRQGRLPRTSPPGSEVSESGNSRLSSPSRRENINQP